MDKVYLDEIGYRHLICEIEQLKKDLENISIERLEIAKDEVFTGHYGANVRQILEEKERIVRKLNEKCDIFNRAELISVENEENIVDIGDDVVIIIDDEEIEFRLVSLIALDSADIMQVSINSPIGAAVYKKTIGDTVEFNVNGINNTMQIINIVKSITR